jgi:hypothetical protein
MTTIGELMAMIVKIKADGNSLGLSDAQIGQLPICEVTASKFNPVTMSLEFAQAKGKGITTKENFIYLNIKETGKILTKA